MANLWLFVSKNLILPVEESLIPGIIFQSYAQYVFMKVPKKDDRELKYDKVVLE